MKAKESGRWPQMAAAERKRYLSVGEVGGELGITQRTVQEWLSDPVRPLPCLRISRRLVRIDRQDLDEWLAQFRSTGPKGTRNLAKIVSDTVREVVRK